jgi:hypothetical protein
VENFQPYLPHQKYILTSRSRVIRVIGQTVMYLGLQLSVISRRILLLRNVGIYVTAPHPETHDRHRIMIMDFYGHARNFRLI